MPEHYMRALRAKDIGDSGPIPFTASTQGPKRDGLDLDTSGWDLEAYKLNPVVLLAHDYFSLPIGRADVEIKGNDLLASVTFDPADQRAQEAERKVRTGFLNAISVGFDIKEWSASGPPKTKRQELLDLSLVAVPGDPEALKRMRQRGLSDDLDGILPQLADTIRELTRAAIPANTGGPMADMDAAWDGPGEVGKCPAERMPLRRMHAWVDPEGDPDAKSSYKFPHHTADGTVVFRGCVAVLGRLDQADIPDADKAGVRRHIEAHYRDDFDQEPPARSVVDAEVIWPGTALMMARLYLDMTDDADDDERLKRYRVLERRYRVLGKEAPEFLDRAKLCLLDEETIRGLFLAGEGDLLGWAGWNATEQRAGAMLSKRNRGDLEQAIALVQGVLSRAEKDAAEEAERAFLNDLLPRHDVSDWLTQLAG